MCNNYCSMIGYIAHAQSNRMFKKFPVKFFMLFVSSFVKLGSTPTLRHNRIHSGKQVKFIHFCVQFVSKRLRRLVYCQNTLITMFWDQDFYWNWLPDFMIYRFSQALKWSSRFHYNNKFLIDVFFVLSQLPWTSKLFMLHKTRVVIRFRAKRPSAQTTLNFALVYLWRGRCPVTWLATSLPHFFTHGAPLRALRVRELR